ncbi:enolase C-terminal domain-like protein [Erwinia psidii]|uniref:glucarate dehydratase n=1 Tax=Erwinia psidii TaxID=69224 RepID=A0A3N6SJI9_9GAMM|nr:enolase C-terminal domain-like protein [Erwinia psidii]MCX8958837.1 glucarate dehydratase [Erwinia psidii]MCX8961908.1 glucarate dehydratase [Erwinia psidii]MCX8966172.1 glucarate dehydratase [Erwinia psidii]RQM37766.1 glucarate dehydratase [Erwinia psidii]
MSDSPVIKSMRIVPVAGYDSMLLNIGGAHNCHFTRILVILTDSNGQTGVGETPCHASTLQLLEQFRPLTEGSSLLRLNATLSQLYASKARTQQTAHNNNIHIPQMNPEKFYNAAAAIEAALLDLQGKFLNLPVADLLASGKQRDRIPVLGYLFYIADRQLTNMNYRAAPGEEGWFHLRHEKAMNSDAIVRLAEAAVEQYGFRDFKLKGGVHAGEIEVETVEALLARFPDARVTVDPNASWSLDDAIHWGKRLAGKVPYLEDPCGAEQGYSGRETLAEFRRATGIPVATNMIANDWRQLNHALQLNAIDIPLADPHFWTLRNANVVAQLCNEWGLTTGCHSNNHFDISLAMVAHLGAAAPGNRQTAFDTHWIWQDGQQLTRQPPQIRDGYLELPQGPGLGVELDMARVEQAHALYHSLPDKNRNDALGMQFLIDNWHFDAKRPALLR